ncbi:MAG TPA: thiolase family protein [Ktedonobacteraceae bacterium]|jgi:acetyl-CoA acyltransferase|nr:thiolase family protein [Ktedonobacteraceae bacterium]
MQTVRVAGAGMTRFGKYLNRDLRNLAEEAVHNTIKDAGLDLSEVQAAYVGNSVAGLITGQETIRGQVVLRKTGILGIPIVNVENACASASTAFHLGWMSVAAGLYECVLALGVEKLSNPDKAKSFRAFNAAVDITELAAIEKQLGRSSEEAKDRSLFMDLYLSMLNPNEPASQKVVAGITLEQMALVSVKNHYHGSLNPFAQYRKQVSLEEVLQSRQVVGPLTVLMCSPLGDGAAAALIVSDGFARRKGLKGPRVDASVLVSGRGDDRTIAPSIRRATAQAYEMAGIGPEDVDLAELHDAVAPAEITLYEDLGFCAPGDGPKLVEDRATWLGGNLPVNTSGGLLARGHPIGATGLGQIAEVVWQLQRKAGPRQVENCKVGLTQNGGGHIGLDLAAMAIHVFSI